MDRFPEAFKRFEEVVDTNRIRSFQELLVSFKHWAGKQWVGSRGQVSALKEEARKIGIPVRREIFWLKLDLHILLGSGSNITEVELFIETSLLEGSFGSPNYGF